MTSSLNSEPRRNPKIIIHRLTPIPVGDEGTKYIAKLDGDPRTLFIKMMLDEAEALKQQARWRDLKEIGVNVPEQVWPHSFENGQQALIATDLSQNGKKLVLSCNNPELRIDRVIKAIRSIPPDIKKTIGDHLLSSSVAAAGLGPTRPERNYAFSNNTFALLIDLEHPEIARPVAIDYGITELRESWEGEPQSQLLRSSLFGVGCFYARVVGEVLDLSGNQVFDLIDSAEVIQYCKETSIYFWPENRNK